MTRSIIAGCALFFMATNMIAAGQADALPGVERKKIESLLESVAKLPNAVFVRNGKSYDAATAAKFLRGKWKNRTDVRSAEEFIDKVATKSSTTGKPYLIRYTDGREVPTAMFLRAGLKELAP
jgi:hypothetical protein